jgi:SAM-dependent methyltransferase
MQDIAPGLRRHPAGYWLSPENVETSYPADGNDNCLPIETASFWYSHRNRAITAAVQRYPPHDGPIFDVGAGNGHVTEALERCGFSAVAIEPNPAGAANAVTRHVSHVVCGGLPSSAFRLNTAGAIGLFDVIEHVKDDREFLQALRPYVKVGGRLYITAPAYQWLWSENDSRSGHYRRYTLAMLREVVTAVGYDVEYATYIFWALPLPIFLLRTLSSKSPADRATVSRSRRQHGIGGALLPRIAEACFAFEGKRIARGRSIPFGGSCLLVAKSPAPA